MTLAEIRAAMKAKAADIRAKIAELDAATGDAVAPLKTAHDVLVAEYDSLSEREARLVAAEARDAQLAGHQRAAGAEPAAATSGGAAGAAGAAASGAEGAATGDAVLSVADGLTLVEEGRGYGVETEARAAILVVGATPASVRTAILAAAAERQRAQTAGISGSGAQVTGDERVAQREGITEALLHRHAPGVNALTDKGRQFRGMTLLDMAKETLAWNGQSTRGLTGSEIAQRALQTTSDFPLTLANVTNRTLRSAYEAAPRTFMPLGRQVTLSDFKSAHRVKIGEAPQLKEVKEDGEFTRGAMSESDETIKLRTYGRVVGITRQVILNDDLGAFTRIPEMFGMSAATLESDIVWGLILANPTLLTDNTAVFHANHKNLKASGGAAPDVAGLSAARVAMAKQTGLDGKTILNVRPKFIIVPTELEIPVAQLLYPIQPTATSAAVPESLRSLVPISEPRLSSGVNGIAGSATAWYLGADPATIDTFEYAYLDGQEGPYTETRNGFDVDGVEVKCRHDFGAAMIDYRGLYKNAGA